MQENGRVKEPQYKEEEEGGGDVDIYATEDDGGISNPRRKTAHNTTQDNTYSGIKDAPATKKTDIMDHRKREESVRSAAKRKQVGVRKINTVKASGSHKE